MEKQKEDIFASEKVGDSRFSSFTAYTALELDLHRIGKPGLNPHYIPKLAGLLNDLTLPENTDQLRWQSVPLYDALKRFSTKPRFTEELKARMLKVSDLALDLRLAAMELRDYEMLPKERLEDIRDFCLALSQVYMAKYHEQYGPRYLTGGLVHA